MTTLTRNGPPAWVRDYLSGEAGPSDLAEAMAWVRSRPGPIKILLESYPPACVLQVRANACPSIPIGDYVILHGYRDNGTILVRCGPDEEVIHALPTDAVKVHGYYPGLTPAVIKEWLR